MKYFIDGLDHDIWLKNREAYWEVFDTIRNDLPKRVVKTFTSKYLHDSEIEDIRWYRDYSKKRNNQYIVIVKIINEEFSGEFIHYDVKEFKTQTSMSGFVSEYSYGELLKEDDLWIHNFLIWDSGEVFIKCKKIDWITERK